jgi:biopolymer transport protein ExbD
VKRLKRHELPVIPTANLVDIAILLIIFYMACSNFISNSQLLMKLPKAPDLPKQKESLVLVAIDQQGALYLQGKPVSSAGEIEAGVAALIQDKKTAEARTVLFKCDEGVSRGVFEPVLDAIAQAGGVIVAVGNVERKK